MGLYVEEGLVFPLKLVNQGKYHIYKLKFQSTTLKTIVIPHQENSNVSVLRDFLGETLRGVVILAQKRYMCMAMCYT